MDGMFNSKKMVKKVENKSINNNQTLLIFLLNY